MKTAPKCFGADTSSSGSELLVLAKVTVVLLQSALQPLVGFWPAQLPLSLLSRKVFTECCCQQHVKPPTWRTSD